MLKIKSIGYAEKVRIYYEIDGDKYTVESKELPSAQFKNAFFDLKCIATKIAGIAQAPTRLDIAYLPGDDAQIKEISLVVEQSFLLPCTGKMVTRLTGISAGQLDESCLGIITACILNAGEYLKGNRAQMQLIFE